MPCLVSEALWSAATLGPMNSATHGHLAPEAR